MIILQRVIGLVLVFACVLPLVACDDSSLPVKRVTIDDLNAAINSIGPGDLEKDEEDDGYVYSYDTTNYSITIETDEHKAVSKIVVVGYNLSTDELRYLTADEFMYGSNENWTIEKNNSHLFVFGCDRFIDACCKTSKGVLSNEERYELFFDSVNDNETSCGWRFHTSLDEGNNTATFTAKSIGD